MSKAKTRQRTISAKDLEFVGYLRAPHEAKPTAQGLWLHTDLHGRRELVPELIAAAIYPGQAATEMVVEHLLMLADCGFLTIYQARGTEWIQLTRPLRADMRTAPPSECPPPPDHDMSRQVVAVEGVGAGERAGGGARARARERAEAERVERAAGWAEWEREQERDPGPPVRPMILDAPSIGCPDHPNGRYEDCGPCGTGRRRHDKWLAQERYAEQLRKYEELNDEDDQH